MANQGVLKACSLLSWHPHHIAKSRHPLRVRTHCFSFRRYIDWMEEVMTKPWLAIALGAVAVFAVVTLAIAGAEKVAFPVYQGHVLYEVLDKHQDKEIMEFYIDREALQRLKQGQPLPSGAVLTRPTFKARVNDQGELEKDANGRLIRGPLNRIVVMEKRAGWGAEYPAELRNGEWEYAIFDPDGKLRANANYTACFQCHKPKADQDFVFTHQQLVKAARR